MASAEQLWGPAKHVRAAPTSFETVLKAYQALQGREIWKHDGDFIERYRPTFGPGVKERFAFAKHIHDKNLRAEEEVCRRAVDHVNALLAGSGLLILPTLPGAGLKRDCTAEEMNRFRSRMSASFCLCLLQKSTAHRSAFRSFRVSGRMRGSSNKPDGLSSACRAAEAITGTFRFLRRGGAVPLRYGGALARSRTPTLLR